ncbi:hypothetical protein AAFF_G00288740 [Aldrovandia affinis]|uniref:THD domain-containing protein n=1 Tax=Aldrovandia affinis TaxID=143900 RepID=A0AAD7SRC0_9TELE|nr:hypothetical protein AAFF_G00288740 [Aldrovandia affinis]
MINTYHTSLPPPPVPPRQGAHRPATGRATPLLWFLSVVMVLQMGVTFGGFVYLFRKSSTISQAAEKVGFLSGSVPFQDSGVVAHMAPESDSGSFTSKTLKWNRAHSLLVKVTYLYTPGALKILIPGEYYVYSQVTFSKMHPKAPLFHSIVSRRSMENKVLLRAYASLNNEKPLTSFQGGVFKLEKDEELSLNVTDTSLVNLEVTSTTFGLFML